MTDPADETRLSIRFLNIGHLLDHYVILIFPTVVIGLEIVYGRSYGELLTLSWAAFTAIGLFALPCGWLADHWSRRNMMTIFFFGTGISCIAVGLAPNFTVLAIALFAVGLFAAIYHPVGIPMLLEQAVDRGRVMALNGVYGNVGVAVAAGCTGLLTSLFGWRYAFFIPAMVFLAAGIGYIRVVHGDDIRRAARPHAQDIAIDTRLVVLIAALFMLMSVSGGLVFNVLTVILPKVLDMRAGTNIPLVIVSGLATGVFLCGAVAQLSVGRLVSRLPPHHLLTGLAVSQFLGLWWVSVASGWMLLVALAISIAAIYGQVTVNDIVFARYIPSRWRGRIYAARFFLIFAPSGVAVWGVGKLYDSGGLDLVLWLTMLTALAFAVNSAVIGAIAAGVESSRAASAVQAAE